MALDYRILLAAVQMKSSSLKGQGNPRSVNTLDYFFNAENGTGVLPVKEFFFLSFFHFITRVRRSKPTILDKMVFFIKP